jgi:aspartate/methionine/tyrosine aminotransferase
MLIRNANDGIMIPIPQYPLFSAAATLGSGITVPYFLSEEKGWALNTSELG